MVKLKRLTVAVLPIALLFGCNAFPGNNTVTERDNDIRNVRYNPNDGLVDHQNEFNNNDRVDIRNGLGDNDLVDHRNGMHDFNDDNVNLRNNNNVNVRNNNESRMKVANEAADRVVSLKGVRSANVIVTDHNAYTAVVLSDGTEGSLTSKMEKKIADQVRKADPSVNHVYVSTNPDFVERMTGYGNKINEGHPVEGLFTEFNETVRRVFPNAR
ncbi:YhcN/YlaJ family sporulation lipoprotein [Bacillus sp. B190/17]|uniref:YhcN/YlaJ family sporulation lipoprotein n=1 Tax=Bacillus lumedeiriae TaxID=3058829 RepID=A0ABW8I6D7_9BACI